MTVNAIVLYWVTGYRPDDQAHNYYLSTINFGIPFSGHGVLTSSRPPENTPELIIPAPTRDKAILYRHGSAMASQAMIVSYEQRVSQGECIDTTPAQKLRDSFYMRDRSTDYPVAHTETVESVHYECRTEVARKTAGNHVRWRWSQWPWYALWRTGHQDSNLELRLTRKSPFRVGIVQDLRDSHANILDGYRCK